LETLPEWIILLGVIVFTSTGTSVFLFNRTTVTRINRQAKNDNIYPIAPTQFTSASEMMQYAFAFTLPEKYARRMAERSFLKIDEFFQYKVASDCWKAKFLIFSAIGIIIFSLLAFFLG
jgi:hypothetical protein